MQQLVFYRGVYGWADVPIRGDMAVVWFDYIRVEVSARSVEWLPEVRASSSSTEGPPSSA